MEKKIKHICTIQRGLGMVEGIASNMDDGEVKTMLYAAVDMIDAAVKELALVADGVPNVHGRWIVDKERLIAECSECGKILSFSDEMQIALFRANERFCYYCGAQMDGGLDDGAT